MEDFPWFIDLSLGAMALCFALGVGRLLHGPTLPDRVVALDYMAMVAVATLGLLAHGYHSVEYLDIAGTLALITFVSNVAFARYLERRSLP